MRKQLALALVALTLVGAGCAKNEDKMMMDGGMHKMPDGSVMKNGEVMDDKMVKNNSEMMKSVASKMLELDLDNSVVNWKGSALTKAHDGKIKLKSGSFSTNEKGEVVSGTAIIDMKSMTSNEGLDGLLKDLQGKDFFDTETHGEAKFELLSIVNGVVKGSLTIKGKTNEISFPAELKYENGKISVNKAKVVIDRTLWEINFKSAKFGELKDKAVADEIELELELMTK
jgi:polyisoprenoid-binding protein YceI